MIQIAVDVDGTCFKWAKFPELGDPVPYAMETLRILQDAGHELLMWTCRDGDSLQVAVDEFAKHGVTFAYHNVHPEQKHLSNKLDADVFIDDKALGCPLIHTVGKPYVDWLKVRDWLIGNEVLR